MRAHRLHHAAPVETGPLAFEAAPDPTPADDEILIEVRMCGICRTDLHVCEGDLETRRRPVIPGHQVVGVVRARGARVNEP